MGYEIGVTPIQMALAANVVATGGLLMEPRLLKAIVKDGRRTETEPVVKRRVIHQETADTLTAIMEEVVARGTGKLAALGLFRVAGKTGTAEKAIKGLGYSSTLVYASYVGFVPSRQPEFTILVMIDAPHMPNPSGGGIAAPVFQRIAQAALQTGAWRHPSIPRRR
jgi:cell division protein FtsI/penicillin-binding protein 2